MRLGTTSYIFPADIITNARRLAGSVADIELVLFEVDDHRNNLPDKRTISELRQIGADNGMTYTVHLPVDLRLADDDSDWSVDKALRVIEATRELSPHGYIVHLEADSAEVCADLDRWVGNAVQSLMVLGPEAGGLDRMCIENLENHSPAMLDRVLDQIPVSVCADIGHLWKRLVDPRQLLRRWLPRTKVVHLHGVGTRDHQKLSFIPGQQLDAVVRLLDQSFSGLVTFEVFCEEDLLDCFESLQQSLDRIRHREG